MILELLLFSGIDMIDALPDRTQVKSKEAVSVEKLIESTPEVANSELNNNSPSDIIEVKDPVPSTESSGNNEIKAKETKSAKVQKKGTVKLEKKSKKVDTPKESVEPKQPEEDTKSACSPLDSEKGITNEESYHYYVYSSSTCTPCIKLISELQANLADTELTVSAERVTKSGTAVTQVPLLEVYRGNTLVYTGIGYISWTQLQNNIQEKLREAN